ncbi:urease accessory protein UreD [Candidatus Acidianus copahuensis]|uniref:urease accessory protein UreD n=1 Tax=Candidatus Acidianus copahuensis TaxID=1160895 RepID=UPI0006937D9B|nr:urease accessory protein UreD [Candidatus Acidianus copahuensis]
MRTNGIIEREGPLNAFLVGETIMIANPSEALAHNDYLEIQVESEGNIIVEDQAFTKISSKSNIKIKVEGRGKRINWLLHPYLFYNDSSAEITNKFFLNKGKIVEAYILGRKMHKEKFSSGKIRSVTEIYVDGKLLIYDVFRVDGDSFKDKNLMGKEGLLAVYTINKKDDFDVKRK